MKKFVLSGLAILAAVNITGCAAVLQSGVHDMQGSITGCTYNCDFYSNDGERFMTAKGEQIDLTRNVVKEPTYVDGSWGFTKTLSSVMTITIDGHQMESCGSTIIFAEDGLSPDVDFPKINNINSSSDGTFTENTMVAGLVNNYKNAFGKPQVVVIQSQLGDPICAYSGDKVYWKVCENLPNTTKLMIDGKALFIHRANFQIIDKALLETN